jgi:integrative and conjugative element protein (TIGR02256 family)
MNFLCPANGVVSFGQAVTNILDYQRQVDVASHEAGGMLLGRLIDGTNDVVVDEGTEPTAKDRRGRFFFDRAKAAAQHYINLVWRQSKSTRVYLGEWHTHPEDDPTPSDHDLGNWRRIAKKARYDQDFLIFVIVGRKKIRVWVCDKSSLFMSELEPL